MAGEIAVGRRSLGESLLLTDLYQLSMLEAYLEAGMTGPAVFEFFIRRLPPGRGYFLVAGLAEVVAWLQGLALGDEELQWLERSRRFNSRTLAYLSRLRFTGSLEAMPEGSLAFPNEPLLRITAPLPEAQLLETRIINLLHYETLIASKAARLVLAAPGKVLLDFSLRRAHGAEAGVLAARASYLAGFHGTATVAAGRQFAIPLYGTMAHSFVQAHESERAAFLNFARARPANLVLLLDTYDTEAAARGVVRLAQELRSEGLEVSGVRLDSGDLPALARSVRSILDQGGLAGTRIFASGGLDEHRLAAFLAQQAPIEGYGIGTELATPSDAPSFDCAYKLQEYAGEAKRKLSPGKATWPGRKQVYRYYQEDGALSWDLLATDGEVRDGEAREGEPLLQPVMAGGRLLAPLPDLEATRRRAAEGLRRLPAPLKALDSKGDYPVKVSVGLRRLAEEVDRRLGSAQASP